MSTHRPKTSLSKVAYYIAASLVALQAGLMFIPLGLLVAWTISSEPFMGVSALLALVGCMGAFANLDSRRFRKRDQWNLGMLLCGLVGGAGLWFTGEWANPYTPFYMHLFFAVPMLHAAVQSGLCAVRLLRHPGAYLLKPWQINPSDD